MASHIDAYHSRNICGHKWKIVNRGGTKELFEAHWKGLSDEMVKVCT
jgi:hypothetical protein